MVRYSKVLVATVLAVVCGASTASAQNVVRNSGNGQYNTIEVRGGGFGQNVIRNSGNGFGNTINVNSSPSFGQFGGFGFGVPQTNVIRNSGNGQFNTINVGGGMPVLPPAPGIVGFDRSSWSPFPLQPVAPFGGTNVIRNSGNGQFNMIDVQGGGSNVIRGSGNGFGNTIRVGGR